MWRRFIGCFHGPRLYRIHRPENGQTARDYKQNQLEKIADGVVKWVRFFKAFSYWTSPVIVTIFYRKGIFTTVEGWDWLIKFAGVIGIIYVFALGLRGIGRYVNPNYITFLGILEAAQKDWTPINKRLLSGYDFEFFAWPVDYKWNDAAIGEEKKSRVVIPRKSRSRGIADNIKALPCHLLSYIAIHTFGRRMIYPGATSLQHLMVTPLNQGRAKLIEEKNGKRAKLQTEDGNEIDTMFLDRRNSPSFPRGNSLGVPFPDQEHNAADVVMQYAIHKLGFYPSDIIIFAWSIGGYPATWLAMNYPEIRYMVLDATFDDIVPLAVKRMPQSWCTLVKLTIRKYMNLNIAEQLCR